jgi:hypothetical protein
MAKGGVLFSEERTSPGAAADARVGRTYSFTRSESSTAGQAEIASAFAVRVRVAFAVDLFAASCVP